MRILALLVLVLSAASSVFADSTGTYTFTGTASGTIGATAFSGATLTVTASGDISAITSTPGLFELDLPGGAASFTISGVGSGTFTNGTYVFDNNSVFGGGVGFGDNGASSCCDIIQIHDGAFGSTAFASYNLMSSIGPLGGVADPSLEDWVGLNTSLGSFTVTEYNGVTFQATVSSVPEPATFSMLVLGLVGMASAARRRRSREAN